MRMNGRSVREKEDEYLNYCLTCGYLRLKYCED